MPIGDGTGCEIILSRYLELAEVQLMASLKMPLNESVEKQKNKKSKYRGGRNENKEKCKYLYLTLRTEPFFNIQVFILKSDLPVWCFPPTQGRATFTGFKIFCL